MELPRYPSTASSLKQRAYQIPAFFCLVFCFLTTAANTETKPLPTNKQEPKSYYAVMPFVAQGVDSVTALVATDALVDGLIGTAKIRVMERSQMDKILKEQGFQKSGSCEGTECAIEIGRLLAIDHLVIGSIGILGEAYTITARTVDVETGEITGSARVQLRGDIDLVVSAAIPKLVNSLLQITPEPAQSPTPSPPVESKAPLLDTVAIASQIEVLVRDEAPEDKGALKPRIAIVNKSTSRIDWVRIRWHLEFPSTNVVAESYYSPKCESRIEGSGTLGDLVVVCSDLGLKPGQTWPGPDGISLAIHTPEWKPWRNKGALRLDRTMRTRNDIRVEFR